MIDEWTVPDVLMRRAERLASTPYIGMVGESHLTSGEIELRTRRLANSLSELGVVANDRVLVMLPNCVEYMEAWLAINRLGAVLVTVNTASQGAFLEHIVNNSRARVMIIAPNYVPLILSSRARMPGLKTLVVVGGGEKSSLNEYMQDDASSAAPALDFLRFSELQAGPEKGIDIRVEPQHISAIVYTSGTSGPSKGVLIPHAQICANSRVYIDQFRVTSADSIYVTLPMFHTNALVVNIFSALMAECSVSVADQFSASNWLNDVRRTGATLTNLLGVMIEFIYKQPPTSVDLDNALRAASAVPISPIMGKAFEHRFGLKLVEMYGSTEANVPLYHPLDEPRRDGSCGKVVEKWFECRVGDPHTDHELKPNEVGELLIRPLVPGAFMAGYNDMPDATVKAWRNLWFHTGDLVKRDADGYFYFVDRMKDSIRRRGENISSFEIEHVILEHEEVAEVAAIAVPSPFAENEEEVKVCVALKPNASVTEQQLFDFCRARIPEYAVPRFIEFFDSLPKTPTQKIQKHFLRSAADVVSGQRVWVAPNADGKKRLAKVGEG